MAKFKTDLNVSRANDEMRTPEVTLDFTPNALASVLYKHCLLYTSPSPRDIS